jgi:integrase
LSFQWTEDRDILLSDAISLYVSRRERLKRRPRTIADDRQSLWRLIEFLGANIPLSEFSRDAAADFCDWLRDRPIDRRKAGTVPKNFSPESIRAFVRAKRPAIADPQLPSEQTVGHRWRHVSTFLGFCGLPRDAGEATPRPRMLPVRVPTLAEIAGRWQSYLDPRHGDATAGERRRVCLAQAALLGTGMRLGEFLSARTADMENHWLLLRGENVKTGKPRILYLSRRVLGLLKALRAMGDAEYLAGWPHSTQSWHRLVQSMDFPAAPEKPHQTLRRLCSTWLYRCSPVAESAQLGHGCGVVLEFYQDTLGELLGRDPMTRAVAPASVLDGFALPEVPGLAWPDPECPPRQEPTWLYDLYGRLFNRTR